ncbi:twin-arginine translocase TatA/TatE family subunit [soil metagenome]|jgi:sec-independent protein translocase protein TatA
MPIPGPWELILLLVIVLIIFGPGKLPDIGNAVGKGIREFRKASSDLEDSIRGDSKNSSKDEKPVGENSDRTH